MDANDMVHYAKKWTSVPLQLHCEVDLEIPGQVLVHYGSMYLSIYITDYCSVQDLYQDSSTAGYKYRVCLKSNYDYEYDLLNICFCAKRKGFCVFIIIQLQEKFRQGRTTK